MEKIRFPFSAIVGQAEAKRALLLAMVNPRTAGLLITGAGGTAKTILVRAAEIFSPVGKLTELPLGATEDMVFGSIDLEAALTEGKKKVMPGILQKADGGILYMDEVNLLRREFLRTVLDAAAQGSFSLERDGMSYTTGTNFVPVATMDPSEGVLDSSILDSFGLFVALDEKMDIDQRMEIVRRALAFEQKPEAFCAAWEAEDKALQEKVEKAREILPEVEISEAILLLLAEYASRAFCRGNRAEIYLAETAKAAAALAGRKYVIPRDVEVAALYVMPHRMGTPPQEQPPEQEPEEAPQEAQPEEQADTPSENDRPQDMPNDMTQDNRLELEREQQEENDYKPEESEPQNALAPEENVERVFKVLEGLKLDTGRAVRKNAGTGSGKQNTVRTKEKQGRYVKAEAMSRVRELDLAFDATVRAAAPFQRLRKGDQAIIIKPEDYRQRIREKRSGINILFVVDASGSMGAKNRMKVVKGVIMGLLQQAYQKRNRVGMIAFRRETAEIMLPVTRSVDLAEKLLRELPTGGKTPLAEALETTVNLLYALEHQQEKQETVVILITDGRTNALYKGDDPIQRALEQAEKFQNLPVSSVIIDTESGYLKVGIARKLAQRMGAGYYTLPKLSSDKLLRILSAVQ